MSTERYGRDVPPHERLPVPWFAPIGLRQVAQQQLWSTQLLHNLDRRETWTQRNAPFGLIDLRDQADALTGEFWFDFLADTGDGGNATYAVMRGLLAAELPAEGVDAPLPEGRLLVLGGDLAYPAASPERYQARLVEMAELARDPASRFRPVSPDLPDDAPHAPDQKLLVAIPQNHDWFDSASTFCRYFVNDVKAGLIGARAPQTRSYFALALPHDWYVLGLDFALTGDLDRAQYEAFAALIEGGAIPRGAQLVLVYPEPTWTRPFAQLLRPAYPWRFQRLEHLCAAHGLDVRLRIAGDLHHYVRERLPATPPAGRSCDLVTCGTGGAFGHLTHTREVLQPKVLQWASEPQAVPEELRSRIVLGRVADAGEAAALGVDLPRAPVGLGAPPVPDPQAVRAPVCWPDLASSRRLARGNLLALLRPRGHGWLQSNVAFALLLGVLLLAAGWTPGNDVPLPDARVGLGEWLQAWGRHVMAVLGSPVALAACAVLGASALMLCTDNEPRRASRSDWAWACSFALAYLLLAAGMEHALVQGLLAPLWPQAQRWSWQSAPGALALTVLQLAAGLVLAWGVAVVLGAVATGAGLWVLGRWGARAPTNASSALAHEGHKGFMRMCLRRDGLHAYMLGLEAVPRQWHGTPAQALPAWSPAPGQPALGWRVVDHWRVLKRDPDQAR